MNFWDLVLTFFWTFAFISYLMAVFAIIGDIFRDSTLGGFSKAIWLLLLFFVPFLTALVYLIARGSGMNERAAENAQRARSNADDYIRSVAGAASPVDAIAKAKALLDAGAITPAEYETLKTQALATPATA